MNESFENKWLSVRVIDATTRLPMYSLTVNNRNYVVARTGQEYALESSVSYTLGHDYITKVYIDGKYVDGKHSRGESKQLVQFLGFRECEDGAITGYRSFKVCQPEICEPGDASANINTGVDLTENEKVGVIRIDAHAAKSVVGRLHSTFKVRKPLLIISFFRLAFIPHCGIVSTFTVYTKPIFPLHCKICTIEYCSHQHEASHGKTLNRR